LKKGNLVSIGKIIRSQGKRGELRIKPYLEHPLKPFFFTGISGKKGNSRRISS
jgi:ribosomal 30S subunit maturation factor RimM